MKLLILILILAISAQPLQAGVCDVNMEASQETSHHMDHSDHNAHDCCDKSGNDSQAEGCDGEMNCGVCFANVSTLSNSIKINPAWGQQYGHDLSSGVVLPSHSSPPFRPPIS
jgi:hypothetical protein